MHTQEDPPIFFVTGWKIGPLPGYDALVIKFQYVTSPLQAFETAQETQFFGITPEMARTLISDLEKYIETEEKSASQIPQYDKH